MLFNSFDKSHNFIFTITTSISLIVCALLFFTSAVAEVSDHLSLDQQTLDRLVIQRPDKPASLLTFRVIDTETNQEVPNLKIYSTWAPGRYSRPQRDWQVQWSLSEYRSFKFESRGYYTLLLYSLWIPADSSLIVTLYTRKGDSSRSVDILNDSQINIGSDGLKGVFPTGQIIGHIIDDAIGLPVSYATVFCEETDQTVSSDSLGKFILSLDTLRTVHLNVWHPLYDSIRFLIKKTHVQTAKEVEVHFEAQRRTTEGETTKYVNDSTVLLLVDLMRWYSSGFQPSEFTNKLYTYAVLPGELFGQLSSQRYSDCIPYRLIQELPNGEAWVQFSQNLKLISETMSNRTNFAFLSDSALYLNTRSHDAGTTVAISVQPDYSPRGRIVKNSQQIRKAQEIKNENKKVDSCDVIKVQIERIHMSNVLALLSGDIPRFAQAFVEGFKLPGVKSDLPLEEIWRIILDESPLTKLNGKSLLNIFHLHAEEFYVQGLCGKIANERFSTRSRAKGFSPVEGDVYIYWPGVRGGWDGGMSAVYRKENSFWKIVAWL